MTLGKADPQEELFDEAARFCAEVLPEGSIYAWLHRERDRLFPDSLFADLFSNRGRRSVPPSVVSTVMVLQRLEGLSDREAVERFSFDARFRYAAGVSGYGERAWDRFSHTVLVDLRERLRQSSRSDRVFEVTLEAAKSAGWIGRRRVLDSTALYDAVSTMDTVTLIRSALRGLLAVADSELAESLRSVLVSGDDYASSAKPQIDWQDAEAREELIDSRARDALACLERLQGQSLLPELREAVELLATVVGQDLEIGEEGELRIARRVARDRVISTVDPEARHGHKSSAQGFDGYKGHIALDPDSEIITSTRVTPGNAGDASVAEDLLEDLLSEDPEPEDPVAEPGESGSSEAGDPDEEGSEASAKARVYGDSAYGTGKFQSQLREAEIESRCKTQPPSAQDGLFGKDRFAIDLEQGTVTCPAGVTVEIRGDRRRTATASFRGSCTSCPLRDDCTRAKHGRTIRIGPHEAILSQAREEQTGAEWQDDYRSTRPIVERKIGHVARCRHGGRKARVRGQDRVDDDFRWRAASVNLARLAALGVRGSPSGGSVSSA